MKERGQRAYGALVKAFFDGTLAKGTCIACACGNIIADAIGYKITSLGGDLLAPNIDWYQNPHMGVNVAGYTHNDFFKIERAFEENTKIQFWEYWGKEYSESDIIEDQYNGLCAVFDVLIKLDGDNEDPKPMKEKLRSHPKLVNV